MGRLVKMVSASEWSWMILVLTVSSIDRVRSNVANWEACGGRLERALDAIHRDSNRRNRLQEDEASMFYQQELRSAPLEMSVSRIAVKLPEGGRDVANPWARVEKCIYEPGNNSLQTRVMLNDLSVSGTISLMPRDHQLPVPAESCRMTLRLRRAGVDFLTSPIARGRGQMRIRTQSSFLEPRFASIYAYGCHPTRMDKQIKRQDKWPPFYPPRDEHIVLAAIQGDEYEAAEPRQLAGVSKEVDVVIPNETRRSRFLLSPAPIAKLGVWRENVWLTKSTVAREKRDGPVESSFPSSYESGETSTRIPRDRHLDFANDALSSNRTGDYAAQTQTRNATSVHVDLSPTGDDESRANTKRENRESGPEKDGRLYVDESLDNVFPVEPENDARGWQSKEHIAREMEDVFLRGASQALTRYIERQLHPAIKETLMVSMGYTISYG